MRRAPSAFVLVLTVSVVAGCLQDVSDPKEKSGTGPLTLILDAKGDPLPYAQVLFEGDSGPIGVASANATGFIDLARAPAGVTRTTAWAPDHMAATWEGAGPNPVALPSAAGARPPPGFLAFRAPIELPCDGYPDTLAKRTAAEAGGFNVCGGGEPVIEVRSDGVMMYSTTIIIHYSPPTWISYDAGETWEYFRPVGTGVMREAEGTENEFAFDENGNLYIFDMLGNQEGGWFSKFTGVDQHEFTVPFPNNPGTVDRPYVRAAPEPDHAWIVYNDAVERPRTTYLQETFDGGLTWTLVREFPCAGMLSQGADRNTLIVVGAYGCSPDQDNTHAPYHFWISHDGAKTWSDGEEVPFPSGEFKYRGNWILIYPVADEAGNIYVAYSHSVTEGGDDLGIFLARRDAAGQWHGPYDLGMRGTNVLPWISAGREGHLGFTFYHTDAPAFEEAQEGAKWYMFAAQTINAHTEDPTFQIVQVEPRSVYDGPGMYHATNPGGSPGGLDRHGTAFLADFTQNEIMPDGRLAIGYTRSDTSEHLRSFPQFALTEDSVDLGRVGPYFNGPR